MAGGPCGQPALVLAAGGRSRCRSFVQIKDVNVRALLLTPKQEAFCHAYVETGNASEAYRRSYDAEDMKPATVNPKAKELIDNDKITARLGGLQEQIAADQEITVAEIVQGLRRAATGVEADGNWSAVVQASMGLARLGGLLVAALVNGGRGAISAALPRATAGMVD